MVALEEFKVRQFCGDALGWQPCSNGYFSVSSFRRCCEEVGVSDDGSSSWLWQGLCPPKVELFAWQLSKGRVMVRDVI